ncbi:hypothetical protein [Streptomyces thermolilacinus]|uniref:hypothetical protein n=1 Tax=Streptomyces thermolilacinus TaxID=285540 RepID=UPI0033CF4EB4
MTNTQVSHASDAPPPPPSTRQVVEDVELALLLASTSPVGDVADAVRERLRGYIRTCAGAAEVRVRGLADGRERDIAVRGVGHARAVAEDPVHDPAANLRLLAMGARMVLQYGSGDTGAVR